MNKTAEEILRDRVDIVTGHPLNPWKHIIREVMHEFAAQEIDSYKYALKAELQSRVNGTRGLEHLSFEDISEIIDTVK